MNDIAPKYIVDLPERFSPTRLRRSSSNNLLIVQKSNLKSYGERSSRVAVPKLWKAFNFLKKLKTFLFKEAFYQLYFISFSNCLSFLYFLPVLSSSEKL